MSNFDEALMKRLTKLEREVERLQVKESPIMSNYLLTTGKAADSDKLDGIDSTGFATAGHDHNAAYLGITAKAADSDKLDGLDSTAFLQTPSWTDWTPTVTGWAAGYTVKLARYTVIGKTCFFSVDISGTSNSTEAKIALPHNAATGSFDGYWGGSCAFFQDNGTVATAPGRWYVGENSAILVAHTNMSYGTWTATGTKRVIVTGFYEIA